VRERGRRPAGALQAAVLAVLWAAGEPLTPPEVQARLAGEPARTTVATILSRLHRQGVVRRERVGRAFRYRAAVEDPAALTARRMHAELDRAVSGGDDRRAVLARFVSRLTPEDEQELRALLAEPADRGRTSTLS
jgi:predicted transcriptional regulator